VYQFLDLDLNENLLLFCYLANLFSPQLEVATALLPFANACDLMTTRLSHLASRSHSDKMPTDVIK
jgi:hypothetical protein